MIIASFAQPNVTLGSPLQIQYISNLNLGDAFINITNAGALGADLLAGTTADATGASCANIYAFSPDEQMIAFCSCPLTAGLAAWGTTIHAGVAPNTLAATESPFQPATLSAGELARLRALCTFIWANGSGFGICACRPGGL